MCTGSLCWCWCWAGVLECMRRLLLLCCSSGLERLPGKHGRGVAMQLVLCLCLLLLKRVQWLAALLLSLLLLVSQLPSLPQPARVPGHCRHQALKAEELQLRQQLRCHMCLWWTCQAVQLRQDVGQRVCAGLLQLLGDVMEVHQDVEGLQDLQGGQQAAGALARA